MPDNPPPRWLLDSEARDTWFHNHQIFDIIRGSGTVAHDSGHDLYVTDCVGAGPLYDVWLVSEFPHHASGVDEVQVGDSLMVGADADGSYSTSVVSWFRYAIEEILTTPTAQSGEFRVRYVVDTEDVGDSSPCDLHLNYENDGYGASDSKEDCASVVRRVNVDFLIGN